MPETLLQLDNLKVYFGTKRGQVKAVDGVSFTIERGDSLGLAGESGCGKTTTALSITRLLPYNGKIVSGKILFDGLDLTAMDEEKLRKDIRWKRISLVFQGAMNAFNPVFKVGDQIEEALFQHEEITKDQAQARVAELFKLVGIDPSRARGYPHEFSGGMRQRAMIAMALACNPDLIIADEPTTALDVIVAAQNLALIRRLREELGVSLILITHDLSIITETCNRVAIMYAGMIAELGDITSVFKNPLHPYTQGLLTAFPNIKAAKLTRMNAIPGSPPDLQDPPTGCRFHPRCPYAQELCRNEIPLLKEHEKGHFAACFLVEGRI